MIGTTSVTNEVGIVLKAAENAVRCLRAMGPMGRRFAGTSSWNSMARETVKIAKQLRRCAAAADQFPVVRRDESVTRAIKDQYGTQCTVPLVFRTTLPAKPIISLDIKNHAGNSCRARARVPFPPIEAVAALLDHGKKFDSTEVWWVPNDVLVERIPEPDPLLVGIIKCDRSPDGQYCFELYRWEDSTVESPYWAHEAY